MGSRFLTWDSQASQVRAAAVASVGVLGRHAARAERLSAAEYAAVAAEARSAAEAAQDALAKAGQRVAESDVAEIARLSGELRSARRAAMTAAGERAEADAKLQRERATWRDELKAARAAARGRRGLLATHAGNSLLIL